MPTSIAATIVAVVSIFSVLFTNHQVSAAEALKELAAANHGYKGWIHIRMDSMPEAMQPKGGPRVTGFGLHVNTEKEIMAKVVEFEAERTIEWRDRSTKSYQAYGSKNNELVASNLAEDNSIDRVRQALKTKKDFTPWQLAQFLLVDPTTEGIMALVDYGCQVTQGQEGQYERFDLALKNPKDPQAKAVPFLTVLFDRQSKLIHQWTGTFDGTDVGFVFSYGEPKYASIHDLGVPADAKVVDRREKISPEAKIILDRLDGRIGINEKLGDYVAIMTETRLHETAQGSKESLVIYGRSGDKRFFGRYWNLHDQALDLEGWPTPGMKLLTSVQDLLPEILFVSDGTQGWFHREGAGSGFRTLKPEEVKDHYLASFSLSGDIWPGRQRINFQHRPRLGIEVNAVNDPQRVGQVGLKVLETGWMTIMPQSEYDQVEYHRWLDPQRDDMPVQLKQINRSPDGQTQQEVRTAYMAYAKLPTGAWYPTRWLVTASADGKTRTVEHRLVVLSGEQLAPQWFTDPTQRFAKP